MSSHVHSPLLPKSISSLGGEADHRIANSLAIIGGLVRLRARKGSFADPRTFLMEIADRIETVGTLHRLVAHSNSGTVQLSKYLQEICESMSTALATNASFSVKCSPDWIMPFKLASVLGLIVAELFSNSVKYAHPAGLPVKITIFCSRIEPDRISIVYEDDGVGFSEGFDHSRDGGLGMELIRGLSAQLNGTQRWYSDSLGIRFEIVAPLTL